MKHRRIRFGAPRTGQAKSTLPEQLEITSLSIEGRGVARHQGKAVFVRGALPGETVRAELEKSGKRFDEARVVEVLQRSPLRVDPVCRHYEHCGGCDLQHLDPEQAVLLKQQLIVDQLKRHSDVEPASVAPAISSVSALGYRRAARIGINQLDDGQQTLGFRRRASNRLVDIDQCPVLSDPINRFLQQLRLTLASFERIKMITQLEIVQGDNGLAAELRTTRNLGAEQLAALRELAATQHCTLTLKDNQGQLTRVYQTPEPLVCSVDQPALKLHFAASDFLQVNDQVNRDLIALAIDWLQPQASDRVLDLFSGIGNFTLPLAKRCAAVVAIEGSAEMVERCLDNVERNALNNVEALVADLSLAQSQRTWLQTQYDLIVLDPPRQGAAEMVSALREQRPRALLYLACDPASLVRDAAALAQQGYRMSRFAVADMFPQTHHIESIALFERN